MYKGAVMAWVRITLVPRLRLPSVSSSLGPPQPQLPAESSSRLPTTGRRFVFLPARNQIINFSRSSSSTIAIVCCSYLHGQESDLRRGGQNPSPCFLAFRFVWLSSEHLDFLLLLILPKRGQRIQIPFYNIQGLYLLC